MPRRRPPDQGSAQCAHEPGGGLDGVIVIPPHRAQEALTSVREIVAREAALDAEVDALRNAGVR
ncbi:hypothetical protein [Streptomyces asiaticus]